jgi:hypothetical protein
MVPVNIVEAERPPLSCQQQTSRESSPLDGNLGTFPHGADRGLEEAHSVSPCLLWQQRLFTANEWSRRRTMVLRTLLHDLRRP